jgi:alcohol dehydrogenase (cytochrome c)
VNRFLLFLVSVLPLCGQGLDPSALLKPPTDTWPTYNGDYSGRRFSPLNQINKSNISSLTLAWAFQTKAPTLKSTALEVNGVVYFTVPDQVWAVDARTGKQIWHFARPSNGNHIGQRGVAMYQDRLYFGTPDAHLICLNARDGKQIWDVEIADARFGYYLSVAPLVVKNRVVLGTSGDQSDVPHYLIAIDAETGKEAWRWNGLPLPGDAAARTWPNQQAINHGGGSMWMTGTYDPELNLIYWGTGNPHPVLAGVVRDGDNLYTCSIVAINADTGKLVWAFQPSPHDTHDWDAVETPVLFDASFKGAPRKLLAQASRNGYYFLLDRKTGESLTTAQFVKTDWASSVDTKGRPIPDKTREPQPDGALVNASALGGTNWQAPSFDPQTKLFYVNAQQGRSLWYLALNPNDKMPADHQGGSSRSFPSESSIVALDYQTGKALWTRSIGQGHNAAGILTTAGGVLFTGDVSGTLLALDAADGKILWHTYPGGVLNSSPMSYELDGRQYVLTGIDGVLYAWALPDHSD